MNAWFWIIPAAVGLLGLTFVVGGAVYMFRGRLFKGGRGIFGGLVFVGIALIAGLIGLNIQTYARLTYERPVAIISAEQRGPQLYSVTLCEPDAKIREYPINGDQWRLEAYVLKWKPWANILGLDSQYVLDRLDGRYVRTATEDYQPVRSEYPLSDTTNIPQYNDPASWNQIFSKGINIFTLPPPLDGFAPDRRYGNGTFQPLADGGVYRVWITQDSLISEEGQPGDMENCRRGVMPNAPAPQTTAPAAADTPPEPN